MGSGTNQGHLAIDQLIVKYPYESQTTAQDHAPHVKGDILSSFTHSESTQLLPPASVLACMGLTMPETHN